MDKTVRIVDLPHYMSEEFIRNALKLMGVNPGRVRFDPSKEYRTEHRECDVELNSVNDCHHVVRTVNDKIIPRSAPPLRFRIKYGYYGKGDSYGRRYSGGPPSASSSNAKIDESTLFVSNLSDDVSTDYLYAGFAQKYKIVSAKVLFHNDGRSKGCGFVRFHSDYEMNKALVEMQHMTGIGRNPLRLKLAYKFPVGSKKETSESSSKSNYATSSPYYSQSYQNFWMPATVNHMGSTNNTPTQEEYEYYQYAYQYAQAAEAAQSQYAVYEDDTLEEPITEDNVEQMNEIFMQQSEELYTALEESRWQNVDDICGSHNIATTVA